MRRQPYLILLLLICLSCKHDLNSKEEIVSKFNKHRNEFDTLLSVLLMSPQVDSLYKSQIARRADEFPQNIQGILQNLSVSDVYRQLGGCRRKPPLKIFIFKTNWNSKIPVIVDNNPCDSNGTVNGYYRKDENNNEIYGLGNAWQVYKEVKVIKVDQ